MELFSGQFQHDLEAIYIEFLVRMSFPATLRSCVFACCGGFGKELSGFNIFSNYHSESQ